ncbi:MAG: hypothetical protein E4H17_03510, partial [Gemmatimonadales bacterium]
MRRTLYLMVLIAAGAARQTEAADPTNLLAHLQGIYEKALQEIEDTHATRTRSWPAAYTNALCGLQNRLQKSGDLDGWVLVKKEFDRFGRESALPPDVIVDEPAALTKLQLDYRAALDGCHAERARNTKDLADKYLRRLNDLRKQYTVGGRMDDAILVHEEIKRVQGSPAVPSAEFILAEAAAAQPSPEAVPEPVVRDKPPAQEEKPFVRDFFDDSDGKVTTGQPPATPPGVSLQRITLTRTANMSLARLVMVDAQKGVSKSGMETERNASSYSSYESTSGSTENYLRLGLRMAKAGEAIDKATVVVQYFSQDAESK